MEDSKHKFFIKIKYSFLLFCVLGISFIIAANITLASYKNTIAKALNNNLLKPITIKNIFYLPPNFIIFKDFALLESKEGSNKKIINIPVLYASLSLSKIFLNRNIYISSLHLIGPVIDLNCFLNFVKINFNQILEFITTLPKQNFELSIRNITIKTPSEDNYFVRTKGNLNLKIVGNKVLASGFLGKDGFSIDGVLAQNKLVVENFKLNAKNINCQLQGKLSPNLAEFKGFAIMDGSSLPKESNPMNIFILNIDSRIKLSLPRVEIERLNFSINNNPVKLTADIFTAQPFSCNLNLVSNFRSIGNKENGLLKNISLIAKISSKEDRILTLDGNFNIDFLEHKKNSLPLEKVRLSVKNLALSLREPTVLKISGGKINLSSKTYANSYNIDLPEFVGEIHQLDEPLKLVKFSSHFFGGFLTGRGYIKIHQLMPIISVVARIKEADANQLESILVHFSKTYGKLSSQMYLANYPQLTFRGVIHIKDGYLNNFEFLKWLANLFDIPSLKRINFNTASANFIIDKNEAGMYDMGLDSENIKIKGYFKLREDDLVSSKIFLSFRRELLQESAKFRPLLKLIDKKQSLVKFNFQLSGKLNGMNFQWLQSDFKDDLKKAIPDFVKKGFEEKIARIIESILEK